MPKEFLLFSCLPFDFSSALPLALGNGVMLDKPDAAYAAIRKDEQLGALLVPDMVAGLGQVHVCLTRVHTRRVGFERARTDLFLALTALRMAMPFTLQVSSALTLESGAVDNPGRYFFGSCVNPANAQTFDALIVSEAQRINLRLVQLRSRGVERARSAILFFEHVTLGFAHSWQLSMLGLFAALEAIFPQPTSQGEAAIPREHYDTRLARRVFEFLPRTLAPRGWRAWLQKAYKNRRNALAHGDHTAPFQRGSIGIHSRELLQLHEIVRLALLGVLGHSNDELRRLLPVHSGTRAIQTNLEARGTALSTFLARQLRWPSR